MTEYEVVFKSALSKINDPIFTEIPEEVAFDDLVSLLDTAIVEFEYPKIDLRDKDDELMVFANKLTLDEVEILGTLIALGWFRRALRNIDQLRQDSRTKDLVAYSQANHINSLVAAERHLEAQAKRLKRRYSVRSNNKPTFNLLGGDGR